VLDGLDFTIPRGAVTGLLGPSGCGKTTLIRAIVGVQRVHSGAVEVLGHPAGAATLRSRVGYVTQAPSVYTDLTVQANLRYFASVLGVPATRGDAALEAVALADRRGDVVGRLCAGCDYITYNGIETLRRKAELAGAWGAGVMVWEIDQDTPDHRLIRSLRKALQNGRARARRVGR
jgi:ABC-type protease/lipase transport system fused ATPase/permease subunit